MTTTQFLVSLAASVGVALLPPAALGEPRRRWLVVGVSVAVGFVLAPSAGAGLLALPWLVAAATAGARRLGRSVSGRRRPDLVELGELGACGFLLLAGAFALDSCIGRSWFGYGEPITRLTAVHFTFAGVGAIGLAVAAVRARPASRVRRGGLGLLLVGPPVVALGFATQAAVAQVGGPVLVACGVFAVAGAQLADGLRQRSPWLLVSGLAVWGPMALALAWALAPHTGGPALSIDAMVPLHGGGQALGFILCGVVGRGARRASEAGAVEHDDGRHSALPPPIGVAVP